MVKSVDLPQIQWKIVLYSLPSAVTAEANKSCDFINKLCFGRHILKNIQ